MKRVYLDAATAMPVRKEVLSEMLPYFTEHFGNPSSIHEGGRQPRMAMDRARKDVAKLINCLPEEIVFTSGATESVNLALKGTVHGPRKDRGGIVISSVDHRSVTATAEGLAASGHELRKLPVDRFGRILMEYASEMVDGRCSVVSIPFASGEVGTLQPVRQLAKIAHDNGALFHVDLTMSAFQVPFDVRTYDADLATLSSPDLLGPRGVGALYVRKGLRILPQILGGGHERGLRSGSENIPGIVGMGAAARIALERMPDESEQMRSLRDRLIKGMTMIEESYLNGHPMDRLPNNANIRFQYVEGESMLLLLDMNGISVASGSACAQKNLEASKTLLAMGLKHEEAHGSLQFTLNPYSTAEEIDHVVQVMPKIVSELRMMSPLYNR